MRSPWWCPVNGPSEPEGAWYDIPGWFATKGRVRHGIVLMHSSPRRISGWAQDTTRGGPAARTLPGLGPGHFIE